MGGFSLSGACGPGPCCSGVILDERNPRFPIGASLRSPSRNGCGLRALHQTRSSSVGVLTRVGEVLPGSDNLVSSEHRASKDLPRSPRNSPEAPHPPPSPALSPNRPTRQTEEMKRLEEGTVSADTVFIIQLTFNSPRLIDRTFRNGASDPIGGEAWRSWAMSGLHVGEQRWDTRRTETGGVGPRHDGVRRPNSGYQALISPLKAQQTRINDLVDPPP